MITNTVSRFESPKEMQGVAERRFKGARAGRRPTRRESDFDLIILCIVLTAMIFGVIHAAVYFTDSSSVAGSISAESVSSQ